MAVRWSAAEDLVMRRLYAEGVKVVDIAAQLGRSPDAVSERRRILGIAGRPRQPPWTPGEDDLLRAATQAGITAAAVAQRLDRPPEQVRHRRKKLVGTRPSAVPYSENEDRALVDCLRAGGDLAALATELGRSAASLRLRAQRLGLHRPTARPRWTQEEDAVVRQGYALGWGCVKIAHELEGRTHTAVAARAAKLGLATYARRWTAADDEALRRLLAEDAEVVRIAQALCRTPEALRARMWKLGISPVATPDRIVRRPWSAAEDELLRLHAEMSPVALAGLLPGRTPVAIAQRLRRVAARAPSDRSPHHPLPRRASLTPGQRVTIARELRSGGPARRLALADRLGVSPAVISEIASRLDTG